MGLGFIMGLVWGGFEVELRFRFWGLRGLRGVKEGLRGVSGNGGER